MWLMSPLSVSDTLPLTTEVDVVIFDEASQVTLEDAVPALCRGKQVIVVGDQMQLPPTNFFSTKRSDDDESGDIMVTDDDGEDISYDLSSASFLGFADRTLPSTMLGWHYRSRSESLISFSNWRFYDGRLLTVPEEHLPGPTKLPTDAASPDQTRQAAAMFYDRPISFHFLENGCYENRRNRVEADHIALMVRELLCGEVTPPDGVEQIPPNPTIGVIAFSEAQQSEIESALSRLAEEDPDFAERLDRESVREENGQFAGLLVKNLENIQGDERDIVLLSICYGPDANARMRMNFGPINKSGGEKRLNVAFSRAKYHMAIVSSIRHTAITNDYNTGAATLRDYLHYADAHSAQRHEEATNLLHRLALARRLTTVDTTPNTSALKRQVTEVLRDAGWIVDQDVGQSHFRIDIAVKKSGDSKYRLGVLLDDAGYRDSDPFERDVQRPKLLQDFGWTITHVLGKDWYDDPGAETQRLIRLCAADNHR
ncbi:MAG: hypothetical protein HKN47_13620 [Pirellulaceae bacterium]|nr:hypothetical protein [Pirellulaceae bacterium]